MPEQRENSVLFSLKELRRLEDDRIRQEEAELRAAAEAERKAREDAERRAREEVERRRRDDEDRSRRAEEAQVNRSREEQLRLQEAERRARVEAEMRLQEERMRLELQHRKGKSPWPAVAGVGALVLMLAGGVIFKLNADAARERAALQRQAAEEQDRARREAREAADKAHRLEEIINKKEQDLRTAKTEEERSRIRNDIERAQERRRAVPVRREARNQEATASKPAVLKPRPQISDNPLDGLKL